MKIGILTYHRAVNFGSVIQAYCLQKLLKKTFPSAEVEIIDYRPARTESIELKKVLKVGPPFLNLKQYKKLKEIRGFAKKRLSISTKKIKTDSVELGSKWLTQQQYDVVVVGSDTVWEIRHESYSPAGLNLYHLPGNKKHFKKISFAASMDPVPIYSKKLKGDMDISKIIKHIKCFDFISVRDTPTNNFLTEAGIKQNKIHFLPDPTLLVNFDELIEKTNWKSDSSKKVLGVDLPKKLAEPVHEAAKAMGYIVWDWKNIKSKNVDWSIPTNISVEKKLGLYHEIDMLITDRFHSSIFSLKIGKSMVWFLEDAKKWSFKNSKGRDLFKLLGMENRVYRINEPLDINKFISTKLTNKIDELNNIEDKFNEIATSAENNQLKLLKNKILE